MVQNMYVWNPSNFHVAYATHTGYVDNDNTQMRMHWNGKGGTPTWVWGSPDDSANTYVYNPANFSVNYANSAGSANSVAWGNVSGKPSTYPPDSHNHDGSYPSTTGSRASGTWGISITGNAGYASSAGNADTLDGNHSSAVAAASHGHSGYLRVSGWDGTTQHAVNSPGVVILGHTSAMVGQNAADKIVEMYSHVKSAYQRFIFVDRKTAELAKYMENCWIATKVTFCNEFADIAAQYGISYNELRECWLADERVSPSHTYVYPDKPYYDSHCLKKDIPGLITSCEKDNIDTPLMRAVDTINKHKRNK